MNKFNIGDTCVIFDSYPITWEDKHIDNLWSDDVGKVVTIVEVMDNHDLPFYKVLDKVNKEYLYVIEDILKPYEQIKE